MLLCFELPEVLEAAGLLAHPTMASSVATSHAQLAMRKPRTYAG
jgi:hypothetical protein